MTFTTLMPNNTNMSVDIMNRNTDSASENVRFDKIQIGKTRAIALMPALKESRAFPFQRNLAIKSSTLRKNEEPN